MNCAFLLCLLLQAVYAAKNISLSIDIPQKNPADVSYVEGKAPEELKAGPVKNITRPKETIAQAAFIRSSNREIPKDDEIENEEFERFIEKYHSRPTIETVFVSTSPSPPAEDSEELNEENKTTEPQAEVFKRPAQLRTFERSVAHPTLTSHILSPAVHHPNYAIVNHQPHDASVHHAGSASFPGSDGYIFHSNGGGAGNDGFILQSGGVDGGQILLTDSNGSGGEQQYYQFANFVPTTFNVAQNAVKTKTYEIRRPAIQKHYYDIEERVIVRPAGSIIVELDRPVAKVPTGETVVAVGGLTGSLVGNGFQQSSQGGISFANAFGLNSGGSQGIGGGIQQSAGGFDLSQGSFPGSGITFTSSVGAPSVSGPIGGFQQSQGTVGGAQGGVTFTSSVGAPSVGGPIGGFQQSQNNLGGAQGGVTFTSSVGAPSVGGPIGGFQQSQGTVGGAQGGVTFTSSVGAPSVGGPIGGVFQQSQGTLGGAQGGVTFTSSVGAPSVGGPIGGFQQPQGTLGGAQSGVTFTSSVGAPSVGGPIGGFQQPQGTLGGVQNVLGFQQPQGSSGGPQGGIGFQQSQGGISISTTTQSPNGSPTSTVVIGTQQQQGAIGGNNGAGFQQSQGGIFVSTTPAPSVTQTSSTAGTSGVGVQQSQGGIGISQGGISGTGFQQSQGGSTFPTTAAPGNTQTSSTTNIFVGGSNAPLPGGGFQQTQGGSNSFDGASSVGGFQQSQGGGVYSTTGVPFFQSTTPLPGGGGFSGIGFQQSQGGIGTSQGSGFSGAGFQQSQGGIYSTTPAPYLPPAAPTPTVLIGSSNGRFSGAGFQQSQGGIGLAQGGSQGGFSGAGFQQSQGGIGLGGGFAGFQQSQGGIGVSQGDITGSEFQKSQGRFGIANGGSFGEGEIIYSTTSSPSYSITGSRSILVRPHQGIGYPTVSTTTGGPIIISTLNQHGKNENNFVVQTKANLQSKGSVSSTTTTERSFSVSQDDSAFEKSSSGSIQDVSKHVTPYKIAVGEPNFSYPPYVEITSNGSPLGHLTQQPYVQAPSHEYPRMRYQGKLLTGEVRIGDGLSEKQESQQPGYGALSTHHQNYESPAYVAEIPANLPQEEQQYATVHKSDLTNSPNSHQSGETNPAHQYQFEGSSKQPVQDSQISSNAHQQSDQIYQHNFLRATSQPLVIPTNMAEQQQKSARQQSAPQKSAHPIHGHQPSAEQQILHNYAAYPQQSAKQYVVQEQQPIQTANYQSKNGPYHDFRFIPTTHIHQQHAAQDSNQQAGHQNLVAHIRHQQLLTPKQSSQLQDHHQQTSQHRPTERTHSRQQQVTESLEEPVEASDVHSSTHQQPTLFQQQVSPTIHTLEPYNSGRRQYKQSGAPLKYTQDQSLNAPSEHTVYFNNNLEHTSARSQNIEIPSHESRIEETSGKHIESSTVPIVASAKATTQKIEETTQAQRQTYASVLAQSKPGILYAPSRPDVSHHAPDRKQHFLRFSADGSSLFSPSGRQLHLVYSDSPRAIYPHQSQIHSIPAAPIENVKQHIPVSNKGYQIQAQLPITRQSQIELSASNKPDSASEPQITRSQSHAESHQTSARYEVISSTTPATSTTSTTKEHHKLRGPQKYRNEQTHGAITLRSGRTYGDHRVIASTPAPNDGGAASESVQTRRIVVNHPFQTIQEVVEREPFTNVHQVTVNAPAKQVQHGDGLQEGQQKSAAYRTPVPYKVAALLNHPQTTLSFHHGGPH